VWPEHHLAFELFESMRTQWRCAMGGFYGLDMGVLFALMRDVHAIPVSEWAELVADIRVMESAALSEMHKTF
jgi:hypothetical protein